MDSKAGLRYRGRKFVDAPNCVCHSRRAVLAGLGATATSSLLRSTAAIAQVESPSVRSVDVHHHLYPPRYKTETYERIAKETRLAPVTLNWSRAARSKRWIKPVWAQPSIRYQPPAFGLTTEMLRASGHANAMTPALG
jgi:hypothetical protein